MVDSSKDGAESDDQSNDSHDVVDDRGNVAADSNGVEGFSDVPLFSRSRVTECKSLQAYVHNRHNVSCELNAHWHEWGEGYKITTVDNA